MELPPLPTEMQPSDSDLLDWLRSRVSRPMLEEIARNDYEEEVTQHLDGIVAQLRANPPLGLLAWNPREVLELERWNEPTDDESMPASHLKRLMACTILLRNVGHLHIGDRSYDEKYSSWKLPPPLSFGLSGVPLQFGERPRNCRLGF
jgi:hypothetical protein